jgi:two-component system, OmpR family, KDP operon response regulator KdpE
MDGINRVSSPLCEVTEQNLGLCLRLFGERWGRHVRRAVWIEAGSVFPASSARVISVVSTEGSRVCILVVDDDPQIRRVMRTTLTARGYDVEEAGSGERAVDLLRSAKYDLVLLDINLPGKTGIETASEIRMSANLPIIMLTVRDASEDKIEALDAGAQDYVTKPFTMGELLARIRSVLRRTSSPESSHITQLKLDDVEINFESRRVIVAGKPMRLTSKEFDLLLYLANHANRTVPHRELLSEVWGSEHVEERKYLRVFINRLRKKIEASPRKPKFLLTEPFVGYRLQTPK